MYVRYYGKKIIKDELGNVTKRFNPAAEVGYTVKEMDIVQIALDAVGRAYSTFGDGWDNKLTALIGVDDREDYEDFKTCLKEMVAELKGEKK